MLPPIVLGCFRCVSNVFQLVPDCFGMFQICCGGHKGALGQALCCSTDEILKKIRKMFISCWPRPSSSSPPLQLVLSCLPKSCLEASNLRSKVVRVRQSCGGFARCGKGYAHKPPNAVIYSQTNQGCVPYKHKCVIYAQKYMYIQFCQGVANDKLSNQDWPIKGNTKNWIPFTSHTVSVHSYTVVHYSSSKHLWNDPRRRYCDGQCTVCIRIDSPRCVIPYVYTEIREKVQCRFQCG